MMYTKLVSFVVAVALFAIVAPTSGVQARTLYVNYALRPFSELRSRKLLKTHLIGASVRQSQVVGSVLHG
jgi:hypothetical protein